MIVKNNFLEFLIVLLLIVISFLWRLIELPFDISCYKPNLLLLSMFFIMVYIPNRMNIWIAWIIGFMVDALNGFVLGNQALQLAFLALIVNVFHRRIFLYPMLQKCLVILGISVVTTLINVEIYYIIFDKFNSCLLYNILSNTLVWPVYYWFANSIHKLSYLTK